MSFFVLQLLVHFASEEHQQKMGGEREGGKRARQGICSLSLTQWSDLCVCLCVCVFMYVYMYLSIYACIYLCIFPSGIFLNEV